MTEQPAREASAPPARCPICGAPTEMAWRPFCSRRCADVDLSRWLKGAYSIPADPPEGAEDAGDMTGAGQDAEGPPKARSERDGGRRES